MLLVWQHGDRCWWWRGSTVLGLFLIYSKNLIKPHSVWLFYHANYQKETKTYFLSNLVKYELSSPARKIAEEILYKFIQELCHWTFRVHCLTCLINLNKKKILKKNITPSRSYLPHICHPLFIDKSDFFSTFPEEFNSGFYTFSKADNCIQRL